MSAVRNADAPPSAGARSVFTAPASEGHAAPPKPSSLAPKSMIDDCEDAIVGYDSARVLHTWNRSAEDLFGYPSTDILGKSVDLLLPPDRATEEAEILNRLRFGERIKHLDTVRRHKDGRLLDLSLTISPIRDDSGSFVGASIIARDTGARAPARQQEAWLFKEMRHRVKNLFAVAGSIVSLSARYSDTPQTMEAAIRARLDALMHLQDLTRHGATEASDVPVTLHNLIRSALAPFSQPWLAEQERLIIRGSDISISDRAAINLVLIFNELATNAAKYGALTSAAGTVEVDIDLDGNEILMDWTEHCGFALDSALPKKDGFGSVLVRQIVERAYSGTVTREWKAEGLILHFRMPVAALGQMA